MAVTFLQTATDATNLTTYTFASQNLSVATATRFIIASITGRSDDGGARTISSVTIGGVTATINAQTGSSGSCAGIACANVPTGSTGDVVVVWSGGMTDCAVSLHYFLDLDSATALGTGTSTADPGTATVAYQTGGIMVAVSRNDDGSATATWTNGTEDYDTADATGNDISGASTEYATSTNVKVTGNIAVSCEWSGTPTRPVFVVATFKRPSASTGENAIALTSAIGTPTFDLTTVVTPTTVTLTSTIGSPTVSMPTPDWTNIDKSSSSWTNLDKS